MSDEAIKKLREQIEAAKTPFERAALKSTWPTHSLRNLFHDPSFFRTSLTDLADYLSDVRKRANELEKELIESHRPLQELREVFVDRQLHLNESERVNRLIGKLQTLDSQLSGIRN